MFQKFPTEKDLYSGKSGSKKTQAYIHKYYPEFETYILEHYTFASSWIEKLYCYFRNINCHPTCPSCGSPVKFGGFMCGYYKYCSSKCSNSSLDKKNKIKQTNLERYGVENPFQSESIKSKIKQTNLERYGVENPAKAQESKHKHDQTMLTKYGSLSYNNQSKYKETCLKRYGVENPFQSESIKSKIKQTNLNKYGVGDYTQSQDYQSRHDEIQSKINNTKHSNGTFNTSKIEEEFASYLDQNHIIYKRQYKSDLYPFNCDFYLPDYELYIEVQGSWTHGHHPYNIELDKETLNKWILKQSKYYNNAIKVWTEKDPTKRETAKLNNLNYLEIFSNDINTIVEKFNSFISRISLDLSSDV